MKANYDAATQFCNEAVETGWSSDLAYNNRGVLKIALGQYEAARQDFDKAAGGLGGSAVARRNMKRVNVRIAQIQQQDRSKSIATAGVREVSDY
jgi:hypothetical protein